LLVCLLFFGIFLGGIRVYAEQTKKTFQQESLINSVILYKKQILQILVDIIVISIAYVAAYLLRYEGVLSEYNLVFIETTLPILILIKISLFSLFGLYRGEWRYIGINDMIQVFKSVSLSTLICIAIIFTLYRFEGYSRAVFLIDYALTLLMVGGARVFIRVFREYFSAVVDESGKLPILIVGAGDGGELLLREIKNNSEINFKPIGFVDDDLNKRNKTIHGLKVLGTRDDIPLIIKEKGIKKVIVSILSAESDEINGILEICKDANVAYERMKPIIDDDK
jgi:UDP-GlcNAc:undecaprenyl-phosphate GlcNAc-1-phosphate transferase